MVRAIVRIIKWLFPPFAAVRGPIHKNLPDGRTERGWWYVCPRCDETVRAVAKFRWPRLLRCPWCGAWETVPTRFFWMYSRCLARSFGALKCFVGEMVKMLEPEVAVAPKPPPAPPHRTQMSGCGSW